MKWTDHAGDRREAAGSAEAPWTIPQLVEATGGELVRGPGTGGIGGVSIDTRRLEAGEAYVAIRGMRHDGHRFVEEAVRRQARCVVVSALAAERNGAAALSTIRVKDTTAALGDLARFHRRRLALPVVAVTGSCGKTTTKDLIAHLIRGSATIHKSQGTQNNHIGVPLTLLGLRPLHQMAVVELGSNHPGEIAYLAAIAEPKVAVITNVGPSHLEFFGSLTEVLREKLSLLKTVPPDGTVILPGDQLDVCLEAQRLIAPGVRVVTFGTTERGDLQALDIQRAEEGMTFRLRDHRGRWTIPLIGYHNVENTLAALACAWALGLPLSVVRRRLASFGPIPMRSQVVRCQGVTILNDCYNANPLSFARALETLRDLPVERRVAIVGDMLELGAFAPPAHRAIGRLAVQLGIDVVIGVGEHAEEVRAGCREVRSNGTAAYRTIPELLERLPGLLRRGDGLLIKGSRRLNLEQVTEFLLRRSQQPHGERTP